MKLKMVAGKTYACPALFGNERVVERNEVVDVPDDKAHFLLEDTYTDAAGTPRHYFKEVDGGDAPEDETGSGDGEGDTAKAKPAAKTARRR